MPDYIPILKAATQRLSKLRREQQLYILINGTMIQLSTSVHLVALREYIDKRILYRAK